MKTTTAILFSGILAFQLTNLSYGQPVELDIIWEAEVNARALKFTPDGSLLVSGGNNTEINCYPYTCGQLKVWDVADTTLVVSIGSFSMGLTNDIDISSDGQTILSGHGSVYCSAFTGCSRDRAGQFEFMITGAQNYANTNPDGIIYSIAFSPDNSIIAAGTGYNNSGHINIYDSQYNLLRTLLGHSSRTTSLVFTVDGQYLISGGYDGYIRVWNYNTGNIVTYFQHGTYTNGGTDVRLSISSDGQYLASSGDGYNVAVKIWKISDWSLIHTFTIESEYGADGLVKFTPNSLYLAAAFSRYGSGGLGWHGLLNFYDVETGQLVREYIDLQGSPTNGGIRSIAFSTIGNNYFAYGVSSHNNSRLRLVATDLDLVEDHVIPVELASFNADVNDNKVTLNWITSSELNNSGFEIEKQVGSQQSPVGKWERIGFVEGKGTTSETNHYSFEDRNLSSGIYKYRLKQLDFDGTYEYSGIVEVEVIIPAAFSLSQNYPNPFNPSTTIEFQIPSDGFVSLKIYNSIGQDVTTLLNKHQSAGSYSITFSADKLPSGLYFYTLRSGEFSSTKKMLLLK
jgi:WD40 repeat protein